MGGTPAPKRPMGHSLRTANFRRLFGSSAASTLGTSVAIVSVNWIVYHYTQSSLDIAFVGLAEIAPGIALGLLGGVIADRYNRRSLMITADLVRMVGIGALAATLHFVGFSLPLILGTMTVVYSFSAIFTPASQAILPQLVEKGSLEDANGLLYSTMGVASSVGSATGGVIVVLVGAIWGLGLNALTYALSALFLLQIAGAVGRTVAPAAGPRGSLGGDFSEGFRYVLADRTLVEVMFGYLPSNFLSAFVAPFFVVYAGVRFGGSPVAYGSLAAALAIGSAIGGLAVGRFATRRVAGWLMGFCLLAEAAVEAGLAVSPFVLLSIACAFGSGLTIGISNTVYYSTIQAVVPENVLARVLSIGDFGSFAAIPAGLVVGGLVIARWGDPFAIGLAAVGTFVTAAILLALPDFRAFGERSAPRPAG